jgi:TRAP-type C4-dicarboxylate transport system permease small subunit
MLKKLEDAVSIFEKGLSLLLLLSMVVVVFLQVLTRYVFEAPLSWTEELSRYCLVWLSFIGAAMALKAKGHFAVEYLIHKFPQRFHRTAELALLVIIGVFLVALLDTGITVFQVTHMQTSPALQVPMSYVYFSIPVGALFMLVHLLVLLSEKLYELTGMEFFRQPPRNEEIGHH